MARTEPTVPVCRCPLFEVDRKWLTRGQTAAFDPNRKSSRFHSDNPKRTSHLTPYAPASVWPSVTTAAVKARGWLSYAMIGITNLNPVYQRYRYKTPITRRASRLC